jgi:hypothetical protein
MMKLLNSDQRMSKEVAVLYLLRMLSDRNKEPIKMVSPDNILTWDYTNMKQEYC